MRRLMILTTALALCTGRLSAQQAAPEAGAADAPLVVHEWGTFTSFSGSDGVKLEFRPLTDQDLPKFVFGSTFGQPQPLLILSGSKRSLRAIQRMETPVTYFYTPVERDVNVRVEFPEGLLTEYYPPVRKRAPKRKSSFVPFGQEDELHETQPPLKGGMLDWGQVHLIPTASLHAKVNDEELSRRLGRHIEQLMLEPASGFSHYDAARGTDSAIVQVRHERGNKAGVLAGDYFEKFLFYRGLGNFDLPLTLSESDDGTFKLTNSGEEEVRSLFLVSVDGKTIRFRRYDRSAPDSTTSLTLTKQASSFDELENQMIAALQAEGLYEKEARAMTRCWRNSWFGEQGTRLLYMVPAKITEQLLPLHVEPQPDELVRVLVGRMEIMPASQEEQILQLVQRSFEARNRITEEPSETFRSPVMKRLQSMGRLAEPALVRIRQIADDKPLREEAHRLIGELRDARKTQSKANGGATDPTVDHFPSGTSSEAGG